jgi:hypothetical protein
MAGGLVCDHLAVSSAPGGPTIIAMEVPRVLSSTDAARAERFP